MQGGDRDLRSASEYTAQRVSASRPGQPDGGATTALHSDSPSPANLHLPPNEARRPPAVAEVASSPGRAASAWYRTDEERYKSVHRRANPWYRRVARFLIGASFLAVVGVGLYYGAREVRDYIERDRLPAQGVDVPTIRSTAFQIRSSAPAPAIDGTLELDTSTGAFEFSGRFDGPDAGRQLISPDGQTVYARVGSGAWRLADGDDPLLANVRVAIRYLINDDSADAILTSHLRRDYVDLVDRETEGLEESRLTRYEMVFDTRAFATRFPLQWRQFRDNAIPNVQEARDVAVIIWLDDDDVLVRVRDESTNWTWERLTYGEQPFVPDDPSSVLIEVSRGVLDGQQQDGQQNGQQQDDQQQP